MTSILKDNEEEEEKSMKLAMESLSNRGQHATIPATSYFLDYLKAISSKFHPTNNPDGYIPLCVAENKLCEEELKELFNISINDNSTSSLESFRIDNKTIKDIWYYNNMKGVDKFREKMADLFKISLNLTIDVNDNHLCCMNGTGTIVENLAWNLCNEADGVLIPAPYYPAFDNDMTVRSNLTLIPCQMLEPNSTKLNFTDVPLRNAYERCMSHGALPKILLITNPHNPTGIVMSKDDILLAIKFAFFHGMHLVSDEIYARSVYDENVDNNQFKFISALTVIDDLDDNDDIKKWANTHLHIIWGFSKDFCVSGFRIGVLHSKNQALHCALVSISNSFHSFEYMNTHTYTYMFSL